MWFIPSRTRPKQSSLWLLLALLSLFILSTSQGFAQARRGANVFATTFDANANSMNLRNSYLLSYLTTIVYPEHLATLAQDQSDRYKDNLNRNQNNFFQTEFQRHAGFLFPSGTTFQWVTKPVNRDGYDPEVMLINTPQCVIVLFRGTDRVASKPKGSFDYLWGEWINTDFAFTLMDPERLPGKVHQGFWESLRLVRADIQSFIRQARQSAPNKKVWVTGHSLGAAYAQVASAWLESENIDVQGCYAFAAPHVGNREFVRELERRVGKERLQRFDFLNDPITMLPFYSMGYERAGTRNFFDDIRTLRQNTPERGAGDGLSIVPSLLNVAANVLADAVSGQRRYRLDVLGTGGFCYHYPQWYTIGSYNAVPRSERAALPAPPAVPLATAEGCNLLVVNRGRSSDPGRVALETGGQIVNATVGAIQTGTREISQSLDKAGRNAKESAEEIGQTISYNLEQLFANTTGSTITTGKYYIRCLKDGKYLDISGSCHGGDGCKAQLWSLGRSAANNIFDIEKIPLGYRIKNGSKFLEVDAGERFENGGAVQTWSYALGGHQDWLFYRVRSNLYVIQNIGSLGKVLDARNACTATNGCDVRIWDAVQNDPSQVWILERAD